jgi:hypothetical protein
VITKELNYPNTRILIRFPCLLRESTETCMKLSAAGSVMDLSVANVLYIYIYIYIYIICKSECTNYGQINSSCVHKNLSKFYGIGPLDCCNSGLICNSESFQHVSGTLYWASACGKFLFTQQNVSLSFLPRTLFRHAIPLWLGKTPHSWPPSYRVRARDM